MEVGKQYETFNYMKKQTVREKIMEVLVGYDKRYTVASLTILTDSIISVILEALPYVPTNLEQFKNADKIPSTAYELGRQDGQLEYGLKVKDILKG